MLFSLRLLLRSESAQSYRTLVITDFLTKVRDGTARWSQRLLGRAMARSKSAFGIFKLARSCQCRSGWHVRTQDDTLRLA
jgi:hypothetical protein